MLPSVKSIEANVAMAGRTVREAMWDERRE